MISPSGGKRLRPASGDAARIQDSGQGSEWGGQRPPPGLPGPGLDFACHSHARRPWKRQQALLMLTSATHSPYTLARGVVISMIASLQ